MLELAVFALIALVLGVLLVWGLGWLFTGVGWLLRLVAGVFWSLLRFIIPLAIVAGLVFFLVRLLASPKSERAGTAPQAAPKPAAPAVGSSPAQTPVSSPATPAPVVVSPRDTPPLELPVDAASVDAVPVDTSVDTSGFGRMDDLAEDLAPDSQPDARGPNPKDEPRSG